MDPSQGGQPQDPQRRIETPYVQVPPPPPQQGGRSWLKWLLIGGGGCLMLIILSLVLFTGCLAVLAGSGGGGDGGGGGGSGNSEGLSHEEASKKAVPVGETVEVGDVAWTVSNVQQASEVRSFGSKKQGNFVIVDVTFINNGKESVTLDSTSLVLRDDQDRTHETDSEADVPMNKDLFLNQVNPGVTKEGRAIFSIAPDAKGLILEAGDTEAFGGDSAYVNLGI